MTDARRYPLESPAQRALHGFLDEATEVLPVGSGDLRPEVAGALGADRAGQLAAGLASAAGAQAAAVVPISSAPSRRLLRASRSDLLAHPSMFHAEAEERLKAVATLHSVAPSANSSANFSANSSAAHAAPLRTQALQPAAKRVLGGLLRVLDDPALRDVLVQVRDGVGCLWLDRGGRLVQVPGWSAEPAAVQRLATGLIAAGGRHLDELHPHADVRLGDGIRVHAMLPPVVVGGAAVSIRVPAARPPDFDELVRGGICGASTARWLRREVASCRNLLITGGTGSGKTTLLAAMLGLVPSGERILTIEDVAELRLRHPHVVALEARQSNAEGAGEVPLDLLLREALRMRPDRIVLGECRGAEIATLLAALNTGHDGGAGTLHASRLGEVPSRLEALGALAGLSPQALARQVRAALHTVVHLERTGTDHKIVAIGRFELGTDGVLGISEIRTESGP